MIICANLHMKCFENYATFLYIWLFVSRHTYVWKRSFINSNISHCNLKDGIRFIQDVSIAFIFLYHSQFCHRQQTHIHTHIHIRRWPYFSLNDSSKWKNQKYIFFQDVLYHIFHSKCTRFEWFMNISFWLCW